MRASAGVGASDWRIVDDCLAMVLWTTNWCDIDGRHARVVSMLQGGRQRPVYSNFKGTASAVLAMTGEFKMGTGEEPRYEIWRQ